MHYYGQLIVGLCSLEAGGRRLTIRNPGQVRVSVHNLRAGVVRATKMIMGDVRSRCQSWIWEIAKAIADKTWEGFPGATFPKCVSVILAPWDVYLYIVCSGKFS